MDEIKIETTPPKLFGEKAIAAINAYGILFIIPVLIAIPFANWIEKLFHGGLAFGLSLAILVLAIILPACFLSIVMGNPHVRKLVNSLNVPNKNGFIVQLTNLPRAKSGFWAFMEDADDIGLLSFEKEALVFNGDSTKVSIPFTLIKSVHKKNVGYRGLWILGDRIVVETSDRSFEFVERSSLSTPASRKISKDIFNRLSASRT